MSPEQVELVQRTWRSLMPIKDTAAELFYGKLFEQQGGLFALGVATSIGVRLCMITIGLLGGLFLLLPSTRRAVREARENTDDPPHSP